MIIEDNKHLSKIKYFIQKNLKNSIPEYFPGKGNWVTLELTDTGSDAKILIPAMLFSINKREIKVKSRLSFPKNCSRDGRLFCTFEKSDSETGLFMDSANVRYYTRFEITEMISAKSAEIKLVDAIFRKANQREFERLPYKGNYNIRIKALKLSGENRKINAYNKLVKNFVENLQIRDISPGGLGASCKKEFAELIKEKHRIHVSLCFGQRMEYRYYKRLITSKTLKREIQTSITVVKKADSGNGKYIFGFKFKDVEKHRYFILDESNRIRQSEAALTASGVETF